MRLLLIALLLALCGCGGRSPLAPQGYHRTGGWDGPTDDCFVIDYQSENRYFETCEQAKRWIETQQGLREATK